MYQRTHARTRAHALVLTACSAGADLRRVRSRVLHPPRCHRRSHRWHIEHHRDGANGPPNLTAAGDCCAHEQFRQCLSDQGGAIGAVLVHGPTGTSLRPYAPCTSTYMRASPPPCAPIPDRPCHTWCLAMVCWPHRRSRATGRIRCCCRSHRRRAPCSEPAQGPARAPQQAKPPRAAARAAAWQRMWRAVERRPTGGASWRPCASAAAAVAPPPAARWSRRTLSIPPGQLGSDVPAVWRPPTLRRWWHRRLGASAAASSGVRPRLPPRPPRIRWN